MTTAEDVILAIRARGSDATDLRDAAHEAWHAIEAAIPEGQWDRNTISARVKRKGRGWAAASEVKARAVEQIVCQRMGVPAGRHKLEDWVGTSCMEAIKFREPFLPYTDALAAVKRYMASKDVQKDADTIIALATKATPATKRRRKAGPCVGAEGLEKT